MFQIQIYVFHLVVYSPYLSDDSTIQTTIYEYTYKGLTNYTQWKNVFGIQ